MARSIGHSIGAHRPLLAAVVVWAIAFVVLGAVIIGLGLLLTHVLLPAGLGERGRELGSDGSSRSARRR